MSKKVAMNVFPEIDPGFRQQYRKVEDKKSEQYSAAVDYLHTPRQRPVVAPVIAGQMIEQRHQTIVVWEVLRTGHQAKSGSRQTVQPFLARHVPGGPALGAVVY